MNACRSEIRADQLRMEELHGLLQRWGKYLDLLRMWHGYPTIESCYKAFFGPSARYGHRLPIPDCDSIIVQLNARILALPDPEFEAVSVRYGLGVKPEGGWYTQEEKARLLGISVNTFKARVSSAKRALVN